MMRARQRIVIGDAAVIATGMPPPIASQSDTTSGQFTIYKLQHSVGTETWTRRQQEPPTGAEARAGDEVMATWQFTYIGTSVRLAATIVPARVIHLDSSSGTIAAGKRADLVLLDADPLASISAERRVHRVVAAGRMFAPAPLWRAAGSRRSSDGFLSRQPAESHPVFPLQRGSG